MYPTFLKTYSSANSHIPGKTTTWTIQRKCSTHSISEGEELCLSSYSATVTQDDKKSEIKRSPARTAIMALIVSSAIKKSSACIKSRADMTPPVIFFALFSYNPKACTSSLKVVDATRLHVLY